MAVRKPAPARVLPMPAAPEPFVAPERSAADFLPGRITLSSMRKAAEGCRGCDLYKNATHVVFGEGSAKAECVFIGEQPGDQEDRQGHPFVGPAGKLLDRALEEAGIQKDLVYITNAVKHFKHEVVGKRRLHRSPNRDEINACRPWLVEELHVLRPRVLVCLGVSAANSIFEKKVTLKNVRAQFMQSAFSERTFVTTHPSSILRSPTEDARHEAFKAFVKDLRLVASALKEPV